MAFHVADPDEAHGLDFNLHAPLRQNRCWECYRVGYVILLAAQSLVPAQVRFLIIPAAWSWPVCTFDAALAGLMFL